MDAHDAIAWHLAELVDELVETGRSHGREIAMTDPIFLQDVLVELAAIGVSPEEFFAGVILRWQKFD